MDALTQLVVLRSAWDGRAELIRQAREEGAKWEEIADATGLSRATVITLAKQSRN